MVVEVLQPLFEHFDTVTIIRGVFILQSITVLFLHELPMLNRTLLYGARQIDEIGTKEVLATKQHKSTSDVLLGLLNKTVLHPVPHAYFLHFYVISVLSSIFWGLQILARGSALRMLSPKLSIGHSTMSIEQVILVWSLMTTQGLRRLCESITMMKQSSSTMPFAAYLVGAVYYLLIGVGVWIEGSG
ncbi:3-oxo-5-alpha-steroid 4-dehydrogenase [Lambiella insularis]|nr:3-oxo-5-alpha-steroid 4-dehydrogenase [Lambiella insularis]